MKECAGAVGTLADKRNEVPRMDETLKLRWLCCPRCGGKTRTRQAMQSGTHFAKTANFRFCGNRQFRAC